MNETDKGSALSELVFQFTAEALSWRPEAKEGGESEGQGPGIFQDPAVTLANLH